MQQKGGRSRIDAGQLTFIVQHEVWDGNVQDHADQGVAILVTATLNGAETELLRFNCFDLERSYIYGPMEKNERFRMDPTVDGNPIGWTVRQLRNKLPAMLRRAGHEELAVAVEADLKGKGRSDLEGKLEELETCARDMFLASRSTVKHKRGTDIIEAGNIKFGLEMRSVSGGDGGLAIHVLSDIAGAKGKEYTEETELLAFDCFREGPHYHYGPRNKNHRIYWDKTVVPDSLKWTLEQFKSGKLPAMIEKAGYPGVAVDLDSDLIASVLPKVDARAWEMVKEAQARK